MTVIGVNIVKINAEKKNAAGVGRVGIKNNISVKELEEKDFNFGSAKQKGLRFVVEFNCRYTPNIGSIDLEGNVLFLESEEKVKEIKKEWKDKKQLPADVMEPILNAALNRCNIEALKISQDIGLPSPIPLPKVERRARQPAKAN